MSHQRPPLPPGPWLVVGLARSGVAAGRALAERGEEVPGVDAGHPPLDEPGFPVRLGVDGLDELDRAGAVVKSPGVPREAPVIAEARRRGTAVIGELELAWRLLGERAWVVVTGTNGKTTTTELLGAIYREAGLPHAVVGNVGTAATALAGTPLAPEATIIAEASSFQLEDTEALAPEAAALLNLEPDHLDRHGTFEDYREAKLRAFVRQGPEDVAYAPPEIELPGLARRVEAPALRAGEGRLGGPHNLRTARAAPRRCDCPAPTTPPTPGPPRRSRWPAGSTPPRSARRCARSPASRTASRRSPSATACSTSTTPRRPTSPPRSSPCARSRGVPCTSCSAARARARTSPRCARRSAPPRRTRSARTPTSCPASASPRSTRRSRRRGPTRAPAT